MSTENKISKESAESQIEILLDYFGISKADIVIEDGEAAVATMINTLTRAIQKGALEISDDGDLSVIQHLSRPVGDTAKIIYADRVGRAKIAMDSAGGKKIQARANAFMSTLGDVPESVLVQLKGFDAMVCSRLATIFSLV